MLIPIVLARVKQSGNFTRQWVNEMSFVVLMAIASSTGIGEIF
jgi:hypothetical protein